MNVISESEKQSALCIRASYNQNVGIYHPFRNFADNYSLSHVVKEQMLMLTEHDYTVHFITSASFQEEVPKGVIVHAVLPRVGSKEIAAAAKPIIQQCSHVLTHDIVYLDSYRDHAEALRNIPAKYIHWSHSAPAIDEPRTAMDGIYVCMNYTDLPLLARQFNIAQGRCRVVYNSVSPDVYFGWHPFTKYLVNKHKLLDCDVLVTYPLDMGRFEAKGGYKIIKLIETMRKNGLNAKVVFVNAATNAMNRRAEVQKVVSEYAIFTSLEPTEENEYTQRYNTEKKHLDEVNQKSLKNAEAENSVCTTNTMYPPDDEYMLMNQFERVVPRQVVRELFQISNLFPLLSISEGCSLTMLEAALAKNLVVLNEDFPPMREFGEIDHVLYMKVSSTRCKTNYSPNEESYYNEWANKIWAALDSNVINKFNRKVLREFERDWIWRNQLEPLLVC